MAKNNKPIYKRVWPYIVIVCLIGAGAGGASSDKDEPEERSGFGSERTVVITPSQPQEKKDPFMEPTPEPLELLEPETTQAPVTRSAPEVPQPVEENTQEITEEPAEEPAEEITQDPAEEVPSEEPAEEPPAEASITVYTTPSGKRYHYSLDCAGPNGKPRTIDDAIAHGYTPCETCVN